MTTTIRNLCNAITDVGRAFPPDIGCRSKAGMANAHAWSLSLLLGLLVALLATLSAAEPAKPMPPPPALSPEAAALRLAECPPLAYILRQNYGMAGTNATMFAQRTGVGSAIVVREAGASGATRTIFSTTTGFIWDLSPSYDGKRLLMSYKTAVDQPFHVWEIATDGTGLRQITDGRWHDFNPVYYPDGRIVFSSSRVESYSLCQNFLACALYICNADGGNIRRIDYTTLCTNAPSILPDGRILCTRWEYQDKTLFSWQGLWTINPDGRQLQLYFGNTFTVPNSRYGGKPIPGTDQVLITMAAHHHPPIGDIALVDRSRGVEALDGMRKVTFETSHVITKGSSWDKINWFPGDVGTRNAVTDPWPLRDGLFVASFGRHPDGTDDGRFTLALAAYDGTRVEIPTEAGRSAFAPVSLAPRTLPHAIAGEVSTEPGLGSFYVQDVYQGLEQQGVHRGQVRFLRIMRQPPKRFNTEGPRHHDHYPLVGYGSYYVKENLGEVPVDDDGSAYFTAPSNCELYFIALDADHKEIQRMGSVLQVTTGEVSSCTGCHENRLKAPAARPSSGQRLKRAPDPITPPPWGAGAVDYVQQVQPVWDRHCISCHAGRTPAAGLDLTGDKTRFFNQSYHALVDYTDYYFINRGPTGVFPALKTGSQVSALTRLIEAKHGNADLDDESRQRVYAWIDANVPYYGTWDMDRPHSMGGRDTWVDATLKPESWFRDFCKAYATNCADCHQNSFGTYTKAVAAGTPEVKPWEAPWWTTPWQTKPAKMTERYEQWMNLTRPEHSRLLNAHLAKAAGGLELVGKDGKAPVFASTDDQVYQALLAPLKAGRQALLAKPSMDMPGAVAVPQARDFGKTFGVR